jgi:hypothetical protein
MPDRVPFFQSERIQCPVSCIARGKGGRYKPGPVDLLKTISMGFIADGLIFKGLTGHFRLVTGYSAIALEEQTLKNKTIAGPGRNFLLRYRLSNNSRELKSPA